LHFPSVPHDAAPLSLQTLRGSTFPAAVVRQEPGEVGELQVRQAPAQAFSQHTPSTQKFEAHSLAAAQACPSGLGPQVPFTQAAPVSQSESTLHVLVQAPARQRNG
jgi:hypothetical protein